MGLKPTVYHQNISIRDILNMGRASIILVILHFIGKRNYCVVEDILSIVNKKTMSNTRKSNCSIMLCMLFIYLLQLIPLTLQWWLIHVEFDSSDLREQTLHV